jgi:hypothetical protein
VGVDKGVRVAVGVAVGVAVFVAVAVVAVTVAGIVPATGIRVPPSASTSSTASRGSQPRPSPSCTLYQAPTASRPTTVTATPAAICPTSG